MSRMDDLISRTAALDALDHERKVLIEQGRIGAEHIVVHHARRMIEDLPAVEAVPVVHGRWIDENPDDFLDPRMRCSICTGIESPLLKWRYCPNCGAKMDGDANG